MITMIDKNEISKCAVEDIYNVLWRIVEDECYVFFVSPAQLTHPWIIPMIIEMTDTLIGDYV